MTETNTGAPPPPPPPHRRLPPPPMITLPPQPSLENLLLSTGTGQIPGFSPGPMTMVSSFFSDHSPDVDFRSFSQLLAGAIASPVSPSPVFLNSSKQLDDKKSGGFKQNKPVDLVIAQSPSGFMFPSVFSPSGFLNSPGFFSPLQSPFGMSHQQALAHVTAQAALSQSYFNHVQPENGSSAGAAGVVSEGEQQMANAIDAKPEVDDSLVGSPDGFQVSQSDVTEPQQVVSVSSDAKDGYNWRKYGQKQVKASEHPRSYYKCTHVNCPVKKKVGMSLDGHVTDIVYKGQHNHEPPQPGKRGKESADANKPNNSQFVKRVVEQPVADQGSNHMIRSDQGHNQTMRTDQGSNQLMRIDEPDDEPNPKRRNIEVGPVSVPVDSTSAHKMVSESKIVVQTRSEVDLLDDGFKWRKYGQKVVKGNTNPRSYYKCTYAGCNVRKHVERAPSDPKSVVTTYEGKHNHDIPVARHRGYNNNNGGGQMGKSTRPSQRKDTNLGNNERPVLLQMKEEEITA